MVTKLKEVFAQAATKAAGIKDSIKIKMPAFKKPTFKMPSLSFKKFNLRKAFMQTTGGVVLAGSVATIGVGSAIGLSATAEAMAVGKEAKVCLDATKIGMTCAPEGQRALDIQRDTIGSMFLSIGIISAGALGGMGLFVRTQQEAHRKTAPKPQQKS